MPRVSVIIPTYNRADVLQRAIHSVFQQTWTDFELIVVDDASTDSTQALIGKISDARLRYIRHEDNQFAAAARNTGLSVATGEFIAFLDSDDSWLPHKLKSQLQILDKLGEEWIAAYSGAILNIKGGVTERSVSRPIHHGDVLRDYLLKRFTIWTPTFIFRRCILDAVGYFDPSFVRGEDVDFYIRILQHGKIACQPEATVELYIELDKGIADISAECDRLLLEKHKHLIDDQGVFLASYIRAYYEFRQAERFIIESRFKECIKCFLRALVTNPFLPPKRYASLTYKIFSRCFDGMRNNKHVS